MLGLQQKRVSRCRVLVLLLFARLPGVAVASPVHASSSSCRTSRRSGTRPRAIMSAEFSAFVPTIKCRGLKHGGLSHEWQMWTSGGWMPWIIS